MPRNSQYEQMAAEFERQQAAQRASTFKELIDSGELSGSEIDDWMISEGMSEEELGSLAEARYKQAVERAKEISDAEKAATSKLAGEIEADTLAQEADDLAFDRKERPGHYLEEDLRPTYKKVQGHYKRLGLDPSHAKTVEGATNIPGTQVPRELRIPEPAGGRTRIATSPHRVDGITMLMPMEDPVDKGKPLAMFEGTEVEARGSVYGRDQVPFKRKSEYTQTKIARRAGRRLRANNNSNTRATDFIDIDTGARVDGQIDTGRKQSQLYNWVDAAEDTFIPMNEVPSAFERDERTAKVKQRVRAHIDANPDKSITKVMDELGSGDEPQLRGKDPGTPPQKGKLLDQGYEPKDEVIYTEYEGRDRNKLDYNKPSPRSQAPKGARIEDIPKQAAVVQNITGDELKQSLHIHPNSLGRVDANGVEFPSRTNVDIVIPEKYRSEFTTRLGEPPTSAVNQFLDYDGSSRPSNPVRQTSTPVTRQVRQAPPAGTPVRRRVVPPGEGGFVITPGKRPAARARVQPRVRPRVPGKGPSAITKITKAAPVVDIAVEGGLSYLTGETDRLDHAAWKGVTSLIPDAGATGGNTIEIGGKVYTHDESTNMITPMGGGKTQGLAYKDGKPVAVEYGSVKGRTSMVDDVVTPLVETGKAIKETAVRRAKEWTKPKPAATPQRVMAVLNGKEGYMLKGDSSSFRMANWSDAQRNKYYGK